HQGLEQGAGPSRRQRIYGRALSRDGPIAEGAGAPRGPEERLRQLRGVRGPRGADQRLQEEARAELSGARNHARFSLTQSSWSCLARPSTSLRTQTRGSQGQALG